MRAVLITGISGSGKSIALNVLEDDGYYCIDNLPAQFLRDVLQSLDAAGLQKVAVSIDARSGHSVGDLRAIIASISIEDRDIKVLFLNARTENLVQRYAETRRRHPMSGQPGEADGIRTLEESIDSERELMAPLQEIGVALDTSDLHPNVLRQWVRDVVGSERAALTLLFESFAYKQGVPLNADLVFDARCLPNPFYNKELRALTGLDAPVAAFLSQIPAVGRFVDEIDRFLQNWVPFYIQENRSYLTVAVGCTGGQHRSVYCIEQLAERFRRSETVLVRHRAQAARILKAA
jgi:RNase adapter protein RapZ